jgi:hypothetical protein
VLCWTTTSFAQKLGPVGKQMLREYSTKGELTYWSSVDTECSLYSDLNLNQIIRERILKQNIRPAFHKNKQLRKARIYVKVHCYFKDFTVITADFELQLGYDLADQVRLGYSSEVFLLNHPVHKIKVDIESMVDEKVTEYAEAHLGSTVVRQSTSNGVQQNLDE